MMRDDHVYFQRRAEAELVLAERGVHPKAVAAHHQLAEAYLARVAVAGAGNPARGDAR